MRRKFTTKWFVSFKFFVTLFFLIFLNKLFRQMFPGCSGFPPEGLVNGAMPPYGPVPPGVCVHSFNVQNLIYSFFKNNIYSFLPTPIWARCHHLHRICRMECFLAVVFTMDQGHVLHNQAHPNPTKRRLFQANFF